MHLNDKKVMPKQVKIAVNLDLLSLPIDPLHNPTLTNAFYTNHLYGNLIDVDNNNIYKPDLASSFHWENNKLIFDFLKKDDQYNIDAKDAEFSIRRSLFSEMNDHADLWQVICDKNETKENCIHRIYEKNSQLIIEISDEEKKSLIIPLLASINYKIVPLAAYDSINYKLAKIVNYSITSGHYYLDSETNIILHATKKTLIKFPNAPTELILINTNETKLGSDIDKYDIDVVSTTIPINENIHHELTKLKWNIFSTYPISIGLIVFSKNAIKKTSIKDRFYVGNLIRKVLEKNKIYSSQETNEFLQYFGEGYLTDAQKALISNLRSLNYVGQLPNLKLGVRSPKKWELIKQLEKNIDIIRIDKAPSILLEEDKPDIYLLSNDVSFNVSFSLFSFAAKNNLLSLSDKKPIEIIEQFVLQNNNKSRIDFINTVHFDSIKNCRIYPIWSAPYFTAANPKISINLSKYNSRTLAWKLKIN